MCSEIEHHEGNLDCRRMSDKFLRSGANVLFDGQWGSTGKGKLASYLAEKGDPDMATVDFQPNAGHTTVIGGKEYVLHCIPGSFVNRDTRLVILPAASIRIDQFLQELEMLQDFSVADRIKIHPHTGIVTNNHRRAENEEAQMVSISSTRQGTGAALADKIRRQAPLAKDFPELAPYVQDCTEDVQRTARCGKLLIETAQGFDLSLNYGHRYPYVTSREINTAQALANAGVPPQDVAKVWASLRTYPIRVGNATAEIGGILIEGNSGPHYPDQREVDWSELSAVMGREVEEKTTVTKRVRRIFTWSDLQFKRMMAACAPTDLFINFINYIDPAMENRTAYEDITDLANDFVDQVKQQCGAYRTKVTLLGTGPSQEHMVHL